MWLTSVFVTTYAGGILGIVWFFLFAIWETAAALPPRAACRSEECLLAFHSSPEWFVSDYPVFQKLIHVAQVFVLAVSVFGPAGGGVAVIVDTHSGRPDAWFAFPLFLTTFVLASMALCSFLHWKRAASTENPYGNTYASRVQRGPEIALWGVWFLSIFIAPLVGGAAGAGWCVIWLSSELTALGESGQGLPLRHAEFNCCQRLMHSLSTALAILVGVGGPLAAGAIVIAAPYRSTYVIPGGVAALASQWFAWPLFLSAIIAAAVVGLSLFWWGAMEDPSDLAFFASRVERSVGLAMPTIWVVAVFIDPAVGGVVGTIWTAFWLASEFEHARLVRNEQQERTPWRAARLLPRQRALHYGTGWATLGLLFVLAMATGYADNGAPGFDKMLWWLPIVLVVAPPCVAFVIFLVDRLDTKTLEKAHKAEVDASKERKEEAIRKWREKEQALKEEGSEQEEQARRTGSRAQSRNHAGTRQCSSSSSRPSSASSSASQAKERAKALVKARVKAAASVAAEEEEEEEVEEEFYEDELDAEYYGGYDEEDAEAEPESDRELFEGEDTNAGEEVPREDDGFYSGESYGSYSDNGTKPRPREARDGGPVDPAATSSSEEAVEVREGGIDIEPDNAFEPVAGPDGGTFVLAAFAWFVFIGLLIDENAQDYQLLNLLAGESRLSSTAQTEEYWSFGFAVLTSLIIIAFLIVLVVLLVLRARSKTTKERLRISYFRLALDGLQLFSLLVTFYKLTGYLSVMNKLIHDNRWFESSTLIYFGGMKYYLQVPATLSASTAAVGGSIPINWCRTIFLFLLYKVPNGRGVGRVKSTLLLFFPLLLLAGIITALPFATLALAHYAQRAASVIGDFTIDYDFGLATAATVFALIVSFLLVMVTLSAAGSGPSLESVKKYRVYCHLRGQLLMGVLASLFVLSVGFVIRTGGKYNAANYITFSIGILAAILFAVIVVYPHYWAFCCWDKRLARRKHKDVNMNGVVTIVSYNGGCQVNSPWSIDNVFLGKSLHASGPGENFDMVMQYVGPARNGMVLSSLFVHQPLAVFKATCPIATGLVWVGDEMDPAKLRAYSSKYNDFTREQFLSMKRKGAQDEPVLFFDATQGQHFHLSTPVKGNFVHIKFISRQEVKFEGLELPADAQAPNIDVGYIGLIGFERFEA